MGKAGLNDKQKCAGVQSRYWEQLRISLSFIRGGREWRKVWRQWRSRLYARKYEKTCLTLFYFSSDPQGSI